MKNLVKAVWNQVGPGDESDSPIYRYWKLLNQLPKGKEIFSYLIGKFVPYTGTISPLVKDVQRGYAEVEIEEHKTITNHLNCIHAIALANLCELTGNLALFSGMPPDGRFIVTGMKLEYEKKARGTVTAVSEPPKLDTTEESEYEIEVEVRDQEGDVTTRATIITLVGPDES